MKYFVISLHRTGTRSTDLFFAARGLKTIHWPVRFGGRNYQAMIKDRETDLEFVSRTLTPVTDSFDVCSDVPYPALYRQLAVQYPDAKFILCHREATGWARSVRKHYVWKNGALAPFARVLYWQYFPQRPLGLNDITDDEMHRMHAQHFRDVTEFFAKEGRNRLGVFNLEGEGIGKQLADFTHLPLAAGGFPKVDDAYQEAHSKPPPRAAVTTPVAGERIPPWGRNGGK